MEGQKKKENFVKQAGILAGAGILCRIIGLIYRSPLTSIIGNEGNGYYSTAYNVYSIILIIASYSIPSAISKEISQRLAMGQRKNADRVFRCAVMYVVLVGGLASAFAFFCSNLLAKPNSAIVLRVFAPTIFLSGLLGVVRGYFQARRTMVQTSISQILEQIFNAAISITMAFVLINLLSSSNATDKAINGAVGSAIGTGAGVLVALVYMWSVYFKRRKAEKIEFEENEELRAQLANEQVASYGQIFKNTFITITPFIFSTFIYNVSTYLNQTIYTNVLSAFKGFTEPQCATYYGVFSTRGVTVANIPIAIATAMAAAMIPSISASFVRQEYDDTKKKIDKAINTTMLIAIPAAVAFLVVPEGVMGSLFPQKSMFDLAVNLLRLLSLSVVFYSLSTLTNAVLQSIGKLSIPVINAVISLVIQTALLAILLLTTGLNAYALVISSLVYSLSMCILNGIAVKKYIGYQQNIKKAYINPLIAAAFMGVFVKLIYKGLMSAIGICIVSFGAAAAVGVIVYFIVLILIGGITKEELMSIPKGHIIVKCGEKIKLFSKDTN